MSSRISHRLLVKALRTAGCSRTRKYSFASTLIHATANYYLVKLGRSESAVLRAVKVATLHARKESSYGAPIMCGDEKL